MNTGSHDGSAAVHNGASSGSASSTSVASGSVVSGRNVVVTGDRMNSKELFADQRELLITHGDDTYRLRLTFQNKLILTK